MWAVPRVTYTTEPPSSFYPCRYSPSPRFGLSTYFLTIQHNLETIVAITDKVYLKNHRQIVSQLDTSIPKGAFKGATIDVLYSGDGITKLDDATRDRLLDFAEDFLDPEQPEDLYTGYPERQFMTYLLELRSQGLHPDAIVDVIGDEYFLYAYPGDILSFLDNAVRTIEAAETLAGVEENTKMEQKLHEARVALSS